MAQDAEDGIRVEVRRRTLAEQVEYLSTEVALLVGRMVMLEDEIEVLKARLCAVERATPLQKPKKSPPKKPWDRGI
jgi:hypothetical protein